MSSGESERGRGGQENPAADAFDEALPGADEVVPVRRPPEDEALGQPVDVTPALEEGPAAPEDAVAPEPPVGEPGEPLPGAGEVVPVGRPPEDEALGEPVTRERA